VGLGHALSHRGDGVDGRAPPAIMGVVAASRHRLRPPAQVHRVHAGRRSAGPVRSPRAAL